MASDSRGPDLGASEGESQIPHYLLPQPEIPDKEFQVLSPWFKQLAKGDKVAICQLLDARWKAVSEPELFPLRDELLAYDPAAIVIYDGNGWLRLDDTSQVPPVKGAAYVKSPSDYPLIQKRSQELLVGSNPLFESFITHFGGLAMDPEISSNFIHGHEDWKLLTEPWQQEIIDNFGEWRGSLLFYHAPNSDQLLLHPSGKVGWWKFAECYVSSDFSTFNEFLSHYIETRKYDGPFDSYGAPSYIRAKR